MTAREDFLTAVELLADLLEDKCEDVEFSDDFEPWTFLRETFPPFADKIREDSLVEVKEEFMKRDPNNASGMRGFLDRG